MLLICFVLLARVGQPAAPAQQDTADARLFRALDAGDLDGVREAIVGGGNVEAPGPDGATPLMRAAADGDTRIVQLLLDKGAAVDRGDAEAITPLMLAASANHIAVLRLLLA